jgi:phage/plasmid primase-like uncharacterized protein
MHPARKQKMNNIDNLLDRLDRVSRRGYNQWMACCPVHDDRAPSVSIKLESDNKILIKCFAGCDTKSIVSAVGLTIGDLMPLNLRHAANGRRLKPSAAELEKIRKAKAERQRKEAEEQRRKHQQAAQQARKIINSAPFADASSAYCKLKQVQSHGAKKGHNDALIIPIYNANNELVNLQFIQADGTKRFLSGGQKKACFFVIGEPTDTILIAEGFATGASLFEYFGQQTYVAFDAGNLEPVARIVRANNPGGEIIICGDNDLSGTGQTKARAAALAIGGKYLIPQTPGHDWNDAFTANNEGVH